MAVSHRTRVWTPKAIPFGLLIALLGAWAFFVPLLGGYFDFGFSSAHTWQFSARQWELQLAPGLAAFVAGLMLMTPRLGRLGGLLAFFAGAWLVVGPSFFPVFSSGTVQPYGSDWMRALRWIGHFYGVGGLILYFAGWGHGLFARPSVVHEEPLRPATAEEPLDTRETVVAE